MKNAIYVKSAIRNDDAIQQQIEVCMALVSNDDEYIIYSDNGTGRKAYNELIGDIENNLIDRVIVNSIDRLCRCRNSFSALLAHLADHKVELQVTNDIVRNISQAF